MDAPTFTACLDVLLGADEAEAIIAGVSTALGDPITAVTKLPKPPVLAVRPGLLAMITSLAGTTSPDAC